MGTGQDFHQTYSKHIFTSKVGWGSHPPHLKSEPIRRLFQPKNTNLRFYRWGLEIEHLFTGKSFFNLRKVENKNGEDRTCQVELVLQIVSKTKKRVFAGDICTGGWIQIPLNLFKTPEMFIIQVSKAKLGT
jgi:hypothetical protein